MRVFIADSLEASGIHGLKALGCDVIYEAGLKDEAEVINRLKETSPSILIVRSRKVTRAILGAAPLKLVVRAGAGYNTIDIAAASDLGIYVSNCPGKNAIAVAELAFGLILSLDRRIPDNVLAMLEGKWNKKEFSRASGLHGRTLGLIGLGTIGSEMIPRAHAFGMKVVAWSRSLTAQRAEELGIEKADDLRSLAACSDVVSVHLALHGDTRGLLGLDFFSVMKEGAHFVNTARAELVDKAALSRAILEKHIRVGMDVFWEEPAASESVFTEPLASEGLVYGTHHIGASTNQAQEAIAAELVHIVDRFVQSGKVPNVVNLARRSPATHTLIVRHLDRPGVLASVFETLRQRGINVQEMENIVFDGAHAAIARINIEWHSAQDPSHPAPLKFDHGDILDTNLIPVSD
jgi:D-3-phosphoglycerate dehydrogenase / 2-oxoglutarate reductase